MAINSHTGTVVNYRIIHAYLVGPLVPCVEEHHDYHLVGGHLDDVFPGPGAPHAHAPADPCKYEHIRESLVKSLV